MKNISVNLKENSYEILIQRGLLDNIFVHLEDRRYFLITNKKVAKLYPKFLENFEKNSIITIKDGEKYKNIKTFEYLTNELLAKKIERKDCLIAFGGGIIGDMVGFCASSILRGVDFIQIPTTLLSQVDSSVGGKTGFNTAFGKNLIGAFYQPKKVLIDPNTLNTLPEKEFKGGMGEVIKYSFIENSCNCDEKFDLFNLFYHMGKKDVMNKIEEIIYACIKLKASVVEQDEKEKGLRALLNFGHTYAHGIEKITNYKKFTHGEAVAIGCKMALEMSLLKDLIPKSYYDFCISLIDKFELAPKFKGYNKDKFIQAMRSDKKVCNSTINFMLPLDCAQAGLFADNNELLIKGSLI